MTGGKDICAPKYIKQILTDLKEVIKSNLIIAGNFDTTFSTMARSSRQKTNTGLEQYIGPNGPNRHSIQLNQNTHSSQVQMEYWQKTYVLKNYYSKYAENS